MSGSSWAVRNFDGELCDDDGVQNKVSWRSAVTLTAALRQLSEENAEMFRSTYYIW
jgi:hypothetical protein